MNECFGPHCYASFFVHPEAVKVLLEYGADVNHKPPSRFANTAVDAAVSGDHADVVRILLAAGAKPNVRSEADYTTLHQAPGPGKLHLVRLLPDPRGGVHAGRASGGTPRDA